MFSARFWKDAAERAVKSAAQAIIIVFTGDQLFNAWNADWKQAGGVALGAAVLSILMSLVSSQLGDDTSASAVNLESADE